MNRLILANPYKIDQPLDMNEQLSGPDFLVIGTMKSGTTTLAFDLEQHSKVDFPGGKEVDLLASRDFADDRLAISAYFEALGPSRGLKIGDASPLYTMGDSVLPASRAAKHLRSDIKLLCILRDPVMRALSHYKHVWRWATTNFANIDEALRDPLFTETSRYAERLQPWFKRFSREQILVFKFEDYMSHRLLHVQRMYAHLEIADESEHIDTETQLNKADERYIASRFAGNVRAFLKRVGIGGPVVRGIKNFLIPLAASRAPDLDVIPSEQTLIWMIRQFEADNRNLQDLIGEDISWDLNRTVDQLLKTDKSR